MNMPGEKPLDPSVGDFLQRFIDSIEQLEILCLLRANANKAWSATDVFRVIQSSEASVATRLTYFKDAGILKQIDGQYYRYEPRDEKMRAAVAAVARAYRERRVTVVETIYGKVPNLRVLPTTGRSVQSSVTSPPGKSQKR